MVQPRPIHHSDGATLGDLTIEYTETCRVCEWQYFRSDTNESRCLNCIACRVCGGVMREDPAQTLDSTCSSECGSELAEQLEQWKKDSHKRAEWAARPRIHQKRRNRLFERDNWTCHLCERPIDRESPWPEPLSPVLDHLVPRSLGGHSGDDNLKAAHALCNNLRSNLPLESFGVYRIRAQQAI